MLLRERFEQVGDRLFRWRSVLPLVALLELPLAFPGHGSRLARAGLRFEFAALSIGLLGLALRFAVVACVARGTSGRNARRQRAHSLNTSGAYSIVRNPLYLANFLCWTSISLLLRDPALIAANTLLFLLYYLLIIFREEAFLEARFGDAYREFAQRVPCLLPQPSLWRAPAQPFSLRLALRREHDGLLSLIAAFVLVDAAHHALSPGAAALEPIWPALLAAVAVLWAALKLAKKHSAWLAPRESRLA